MSLILKIAGILQIGAGIVIFVISTLFGGGVMSILLTLFQGTLGELPIPMEGAILFLPGLIFGIIIGGNITIGGIALFVLGSVYEILKEMRKKE